MTDLPKRCPSCDRRVWSRSRIDHLGRVFFVDDPHVCAPVVVVKERQWRPKALRGLSRKDRKAVTCACGQPRLAWSKRCPPCALEHERQRSYAYRQTPEFRARRRDRYLRIEQRKRA